MTEHEYIEQRLDDQIQWYSSKSTKAKNTYNRWQVVKILAAISIPVLAMWLPAIEEMKYVIGVIGAFIALAEGMNKLKSHNELWLGYRLTSESLKREKILFQTKSGPYTVSNPFKLLVIRCEDLMVSENSAWREAFDGESA